MSETTKPAYYMVQCKAKSLDELVRRYGGGAMATIQQFDGQMIAGTPAPKVVEGRFDGNWSAILRFPSLGRAQAWYESAEYRPLRDLRINELEEESHILLLEGM